MFGSKDDESESINYDDHGNSTRLFITIDSSKSYGNYLSGFMNLYIMHEHKQNSPNKIKRQAKRKEFP